MGIPMRVLILDLGVHIQVYSPPVSESVTLPMSDSGVALLPGEVDVGATVAIELEWSTCLRPSLTALAEIASAEMRRVIFICISGIPWPAERVCNTVCGGLMHGQRLYMLRVGSVGLGSLHSIRF